MLSVIPVATLGLTGERHAQFGGRAAGACGLISVAFGFVLTYRICVVDGLIAGHILTQIRPPASPTDDL